jgi:hypothetical protein
MVVLPGVRKAAERHFTIAHVEEGADRWIESVRFLEALASARGITMVGGIAPGAKESLCGGRIPFLGQAEP